MFCVVLGFVFSRLAKTVYRKSVSKIKLMLYLVPCVTSSLEMDCAYHSLTAYTGAQGMWNLAIETVWLFDGVECR